MSRKVGAPEWYKWYMAASRFCCRKALVGPGWAISLLLCTNWFRKQISGLVGPPIRFFSVCVDGHWPRAMTIENLLMSGLNHRGWLQGQRVKV